ncbi:MAG: MFS transporter [Desulfobacterales bacterium]
MNSTKTILGLFLSVFVMMIGVGMIVAVLPERYMALSRSPHTVGSLATAFAFSYLLVQFRVGRLADRWGFKPFLVAGYWVCSAAGLCFYFSTDALMLILGRFIQGIGEAPVWSLAPAVLALQHPNRMGRLMGGYNSILHVGLALGPATGMLVIRWMPADAAFALYGVLCLLGGIILIFTLTPGRLAQPEALQEVPGIREISSFTADRRVTAVLIGVALYGAGYGAFLTVIPVFLTLVKGFGQTGIGWFFSAFYLAVGAASFLAGPLSDRFGRRGFMVVGLAAAAMGLALAPALNSIVLAGLLILSILALGVFGISSLAFLNECAGESAKGTYSGAYFLSWGLGMFSGPVLIGWVDASTTPGTGIRCFGIAMAIHALAMHRVLWAKPRPESG